MSLSTYYPVRLATSKSYLKDILLVLGASFLISLFSQVALPLPFTPVPLVLQCHLCLFLGAALGSKRGAMAVLLFILQGMFGLPVFAKGASGFTALLGPTGGYLVGYVVGAFLSGYLFERAQTRSVKSAFLSMLAGNAAVHFFGVAYLATFIGLSSAVLLGFVPFIVTDVIKLLVAAKGLAFRKAG